VPFAIQIKRKIERKASEGRTLARDNFRVEELLRGDNGVMIYRRSRLTLTENPGHHVEKANCLLVQSGYSYENTAF
jgi:hypothetical protein